MRQTYKSRILLFCFLAISWVCQGNTIEVQNGVDRINDSFTKREYSKTINKQFPITTDGMVEISNRYGKVEIKTWDNSEVKVEVVISVNATSEDRAEDVFDRITIDFNSGRDFVSATTELSLIHI